MTNALEIIPYHGWKKNVRLSNGAIELIVALDVGPRVIHLGFNGGRNVFGEFPEQLGRSGESGWVLRGGHRLWVGPEDKALTYEPDNGPVDFEEIPDGIRTMQKPGPRTGIRKIMEIRMLPDRNEVEVIHQLVNAGPLPVTCAPWALSVMAARGTAIVPLPPLVLHDDRVTPNQNWSLWGYTDMTDPRLKIGTKYLLVRQEPGGKPFKLGLAEREGWVAYAVDGCLFTKRFERDDSKPYPDGDVNLEVYTDERILELETFAPVTTLAPGESVRHEERWSLDRCSGSCASEDDVEAGVLPIVRGLSAGRARRG